MGKRKKPQLKPVVRGFATTSVPSKKSLAEAESVASDTNDEQVTLNTSGETTKGTSAKSNEVTLISSEENPVDQTLQALVDKWQDKVERDIGRTLKSIEFDRRMTKNYARLQFDASWRDQALNLALSEEDSTSLSTADENEEKLLIRLGNLYGVLHRLGIPPDRIDECLAANRKIDIEEAFEWMHVHCAEDELVWERDKIIYDMIVPRTPRVGFSYNSVPSTPSLSTIFSSLEINNSDNNSMDHVITHGTLSHPPLISDNESVEADTLDPGKGFHTKEQSAYDDDMRYDVSDETDPNIIHAISRLHVLHIQRSGQAAERQAQLSVLKSRIDNCASDYLFSKRVAEAEFTSRRAALDSTTLASRLRNGMKPGQLPVDTKPKNASGSQSSSQLPSHNSTSLPTTAPSTPQEPAEETMFGNLLDEDPTEVTTDSGIIIQIKDMSLPKHWSGKTPKILLSEVINKKDRYATVSFKVISGGSRAVRCACQVRWAGARMEEWTMDTVACRDSSQAEQYVATLALHNLAFPVSLGFAGGTSAGIMASSFRALPPSFRDLWNQLEGSRKLEEDAVNRSIWTKLRTLLQTKLGQKEVVAKVGKVHEPTQTRVASRHQTASTELSPEQIMANFYARQSSYPYQVMLQQRQSLPIAAYRQEIVKTLELHQVLVLSGETGCGKSTQLPAFIMEDHLSRGQPCRIICTEPRRISAISLAQRVSAEMGEPPGAVGTNNSLIGYSIRLESNMTKATRLAFVTNGIALRMLEGGGGGGPAIDDVTHLIVDEVHERSIESDFLLIILKSLLEQRPDLRVVLMSATLDAQKISAFFKNCPIIQVPGRTFPVDVRFLEDAVDFTSWHIKDSSPYAKRQKNKFSLKQFAQMDWTEDIPEQIEEEEGAGASEGPVVLEKRYSPQTIATVNLLDERLIPYELIVRLLETLCFENEAYIPYSAAILVFMPGLNEIRRLHDLLLSHQLFSEDAFRIYPLHSTISSEGQGAVFEIPPAGVRKIVISSNISETGITIPDITAVIDSGKHRQMMFDEKKQLSRLVETFIAKSNAAQRRGRAGRVRQGLCFHLFTKARHDTMMAEHPVPEMLRLSLSDLALRTKIMKVNVGTSIEDILSKALDPPSHINIQRAVSSLVEVRALTATEEITGLGRYLAQLPTDVHLGKFLLMAAILKCLDPALTIAAALSSKSPFITPLGREDEAERAKVAFRVDNSDFLTIHNAFSAWRRAWANGQHAARALCRKSFLSYQNLQQIEEIRQQYLTYLVDSSFIEVDRAYERELNRARFSQNRGRVHFVSVPSELDVNSLPGKNAIINAALVAGLFPKILTIDTSMQVMKTLGNNQPTYFHPSSINFGRKPLDVSGGGTCLTYFTLMYSKKLYAWETGPVDDIAMILLCGEVDFKYSSNTIVLDRKIKYSVDSKSIAALKYLRDHLQGMLQVRFKGRNIVSSTSWEQWNSLVMAVLGKKVEDETAE